MDRLRPLLIIATNTNIVNYIDVHTAQGTITDWEDRIVLIILHWLNGKGNPSLQSWSQIIIHHRIE